MNALIKDNKVYCPVCHDNNVRRVGNCNQTKHGTQMTIHCDDCNGEFEYYVKPLVNAKNIRYVVEEEENE